MGAVGRQVQFLGLIVVVAAGLAATVLAVVGFWMVLTGLGLLANRGDSPVGLVGVIFVCVAVAVLWAAWSAAAEFLRRLALTPVRAVGSLAAVYAGGPAVATLLWSACSEGTGATRAGPALVFVFASVAAVALVVSRPTEIAPALLVGMAATAAVVFWWLSTNTAAVGCPWHQPTTPTPVPAPTTTTSALNGQTPPHVTS